ncbi:hypothetical protein BKA63DRAFT_465133 [Paraphoma chrysanthemicola]|nr:hypothetical protein BKA63DRAFT_465133 [Paraphoma chrysanthemicola]
MRQLSAGGAFRLRAMRALVNSPAQVSPEAHRAHAYRPSLHPIGVDVLIMDEASEDVINEIISWCSTSSLKALCLSSKKLSRIATPHLYSTLVLEQRGSNNRVTVGPFKYLLPIAYLIFSSPTHASWVRSLVVAGEWGQNDEYAREETGHVNERKRPWPHYGTPVLEDILWDRCSDYALTVAEAKEKYFRIYIAEKENAIIPLLLFSLPRLRKLDLHYALWGHLDLTQMLGRVGNRVSPFEDTHTMSKGVFTTPIDILVKSDRHEQPQNPQDLALFLNLPRLRSLYGWNMGDSEGELQINMHELITTTLKPCSCPVEYIELRASKLMSRNLDSLIDATIPGKLKSFNYEIGAPISWPSCSINHKTILSSLQSQFMTLEALGLTHEDLYPYQFGSDGDDPCAISLTSFNALRRLKIAPVYIWGNDIFRDEEAVQSPRTKDMLWQALPPSLEQLWITRAQCQNPVTLEDGPHDELPFIPLCLLPALEIVIKRRPDSFPNLVDLRIEFPPSAWEPEWFADLASVCDAAEAAGIWCTIILAESKIPDTGTDVERGWGWDEDVQWEPCFLNQEYAKTWIKVAEERNLAERLSVYREEILRLWDTRPLPGVRALLEMG